MLIVEDEQISRKALASLLESCGYKAASYESAEELLAHLGEHATPLIMLVDVDLPGMNGLELIERLRRERPPIRTVLITAVEGDRIARFQRDHPVEYLRKPLNFPRLLRLLKQLQQQRTRPH